MTYECSELVEFRLRASTAYRAPLQMVSYRAKSATLGEGVVKIWAKVQYFLFELYNSLLSIRPVIWQQIHFVRHGLPVLIRIDRAPLDRARPDVRDNRDSIPDYYMVS